MSEQPSRPVAEPCDTKRGLTADAGLTADTGPREQERAAPSVDPLSAMRPRFSFFFRRFARRYFGHFDLEPAMVERLRDLEQRGAVVYVMRYSSRLDYFLFNALFLRVGLRLSSFANGLNFYYYGPLLDWLRLALFRKRGRPHEIRRVEQQEYARAITREGGSFFLFLRTARLRSFLRGRRARRRQDELDLLHEVVRASWDCERGVALVPLTIFWRKGPRSETRFLNLSYGALTRPSDLAKVTSFLATYRGLSVKTGDPIDLCRFIAERRHEGPAPVARKVRRAILMYLYREEKVVEGPTLKAPHRVLEQVLGDAGVRAAIAERARGKRGSLERAEVDAEKNFYEIAANQNSTFLAVLAWLVGLIFRRMFASIEVTGLDKVAEYAKRHPLVLVPTHRSYFDFLIVSWLFYRNFLVPPHIAARDNMAFGPFGFIWRRAGAFFLRGSFEDPLYKQVFRAYVAYLVREGFPQEFFIEGGRSRTGKTLAPRLGMLSWDVDAFLESARRDLFFVPIAITYERLVEEGAMVDLLSGGEKQRESMLGLVRARKFLQRRFGSVHVNFGEPISLADALGARRPHFRVVASEEVAAEKRLFVEVLANRIVEHINWAVVPNATSVAASVLLGARSRGLLRVDLVRLMQRVVELLRLQDVRLTAALVSDEDDFSESIAFLLRSDLVRSVEDPRGEILYFEDSKLRALDLYRNSIVHYLAAPSFLARRLRGGATLAELREDVATWQELLYQEFFTPRGEVLAAHIEGFLDYFERSGWIERREGRLVPTGSDHGFFDCLAAQTRGVIEAYHAACTALLHVENDLDRKEFYKRAADHFRHSELLGEAGRREASNETTFSNALDLLVRRGILEERASGARRRDTRFARGEAWETLETLRRRLANALDAR